MNAMEQLREMINNSINIVFFGGANLHLNHVLVDTVGLFKRLRLTLMLACTLNAAL